MRGFRMNDLTFADWLNSELKIRNLTPADLSRLSGINDGLLSRHLRGKSTPTPKSLRKYALAFKIPIDKLYLLVGYYPTETNSFCNSREELIGIFKKLTFENKRELILMAQGILFLQNTSE